MLFFTVADTQYAQFAPLLVASALYHNPDAHVQIVLPLSMMVNGSPNFESSVRRWGNKVMICWNNIVENENIANYGSYRWLLEPHLYEKPQYVYICDIDFVILTNVETLHLPQMEKTGLPYSNAVREGQKKLTGLHFTEWSALFPNNFLSRNVRGINDEELLFQIVKEKVGRFPCTWYRPEPGIHLSPLRRPFPSVSNGVSIPGWGMEPWVKQFQEFSKSKDYQELVLSDYVRNRLKVVEKYCEGQDTSEIEVVHG